VIATIALGAAWDAALCFQFAQRLVKCQQRVRGRGETELAAVLQSLPLCVKV
jgi:hypothetical protein